MGRSNFSFGRTLLFILLGLVMGGILGESLGLLFGELGEIFNAGGTDNIVRNTFVKAWELSVGMDHPILIDLYMIQLNLGIGFKLNLVSIIGMVGALYIMKWSGDR